MADRLVNYVCAAGHRVSLRMDGKLADAVRARRAKNKTCEVGVGEGRVCNAALHEESISG
jgi:hypothetical protein